MTFTERLEKLKELERKGPKGVWLFDLTARAMLLDKVMEHVRVVLKGTNMPSTLGKFLAEYDAMEGGDSESLPK